MAFDVSKLVGKTITMQWINETFSAEVIEANTGTNVIKVSSDSLSSPNRSLTFHPLGNSFNHESEGQYTVGGALLRFDIFIPMIRHYTSIGNAYREMIGAITTQVYDPITETYEPSSAIEGIKWYTWFGEGTWTESNFLSNFTEVDIGQYEFTHVGALPDESTWYYTDSLAPYYHGLVLKCIVTRSGKYKIQCSGSINFMTCTGKPITDGDKCLVLLSPNNYYTLKGIIA